MAVYLLVDYVPWAKLRALSQHVQIQIPSVAFLATATFTALPSPTHTLTATGTPTPSPMPTHTPLPPTETPTAPLPTATRRPAPTRTPKPPFDAPRLIGPENQAEFHGGDAQIQLSWASVGVLDDDQWYALSIRFTAEGVVHYSGTWTKETNWIVPRELYTKAGQSERAFKWDVTVMRQTGIKADGGREGVALSPVSETRIFFWY